MPFTARLLLLSLMLAFAADASAQSGARQREARRSEAADTVRRVERETGGEVLRTDRMQRDGRDVYRVKVLTPEGRVRVMQDDPRARREREVEDATRGPEGGVDGDPRRGRDKQRDQNGDQPPHS